MLNSNPLWLPLDNCPLFCSQIIWESDLQVLLPVTSLRNHGRHASVPLLQWDFPPQGPWWPAGYQVRWTITFSSCVASHCIPPWNSLVTWFQWCHTVLAFLFPVWSNLGPLKSPSSLWPEGNGCYYNLIMWSNFSGQWFSKLWSWISCLSITWELLKCRWLGPTPYLLYKKFWE